MAEAIIGGILSNSVSVPEDISVGEPLESRRNSLNNQHGVYATSSNPDAAAKGAIVVLSVKPQNLPETMREMKGCLGAAQTVLSIVAGARISAIQSGLGHASVIRVMPNTPAQIGQGMSLWTCSSEVDDATRTLAQSILGTMGREIYVSSEKYLDMATALSASGPAYVFTFIEALTDAGVYLGLPREMSHTLALQTALGSTLLVKETGKHPAVLRDMVTSPGGTTVEALLTLEEAGFRAAIINAVKAAYEKSVELGEEG